MGLAIMAAESSSPSLSFSFSLVCDGFGEKRCLRSMQRKEEETALNFARGVGDAVVVEEGGGEGEV